MKRELLRFIIADLLLDSGSVSESYLSHQKHMPLFLAQAIHRVRLGEVKVVLKCDLRHRRIDSSKL